MKGLTYLDYFRWDTFNYKYDIIMKDETGRVIHVNAYYPEMDFDETEVELFIETFTHKLSIEFFNTPDLDAAIGDRVGAPRMVGVYNGFDGMKFGITDFRFEVSIHEEKDSVVRTDIFKLTGGREIVIQISPRLIDKNSPKGAMLQ